MDAIKTVEDYRKVLLRINTLMNKGSQAITYEEMSEIRELRSQASSYEKVRYDHTINSEEGC
ncbi:hypothetical protein EZ456_04325 [Pedobacter psychrodurus]|uniref:Uncharacterized protein n=1 Tax=Pedobacter psychrodurus TaxID=2530456 RepID=A0A4R0PZF5_9SPHI|nr:hypothetical protein [Pedobacter psychrodurus]TCD28621.1 hypothetical protein EZ456_04325 [Pedobacter psychrodurus]